MSSGSLESLRERGSSGSNRYAPDNNRDERVTNLEICHHLHGSGKINPYC